jgi:hypothetical protein
MNISALTRRAVRRHTTPPGGAPDHTPSSVLKRRPGAARTRRPRTTDNARRAKPRAYRAAAGSAQRDGLPERGHHDGARRARTNCIGMAHGEDPWAVRAS